jgi:hypothetical protein
LYCTHSDIPSVLFVRGAELNSFRDLQRPGLKAVKP